MKLFFLNKLELTAQVQFPILSNYLIYSQDV